MATEKMFTELPTVSSPQLTDIICAVQGYTSPSNLGLSVQESLQQVYNLFQSNVILVNAGNPNGVVAGTTYQLCWDTLDDILWVCTTTGSASTAVWQQCISGVGTTWVNQSTSPVTLSPGTNYICNAGVTTINFTLPTTAGFGTIIRIAGASAGGWTIAQNNLQYINFGNLTTTVGVGGSLASTNQNDYVELLCISANTGWNVIGSIGMITVV